MPAKLKKRILAVFIDWLIIVAYALCLLGVMLLFYTFVLKGFPKINELQGNLISFFSLLFPVLLYFIIFENSSKHASIGKRKMGLKLASTSGELQFWQPIIRNIIKFIPWQLAHMVLYNGFAHDNKATMFLWICIIGTYGIAIINVVCTLIRKDRRALHDLLAGTIVVENE